MVPDGPASFVLALVCSAEADGSNPPPPPPPPPPSLCRFFLQYIVAGNQAIQPNPNTSRLVHDLPSIESMFPLVGYTSACKELESVASWQTRRATLRSDQDQSRLCKSMDVFTINGVLGVEGRWACAVPAAPTRLCEAALQSCCVCSAASALTLGLLSCRSTDAGTNFGTQVPIVSIGEGMNRESVELCSVKDAPVANTGMVYRATCIERHTHSLVVFRGIPGQVGGSRCCFCMSVRVPLAGCLLTAAGVCCCAGRQPDRTCQGGAACERTSSVGALVHVLVGVDGVVAAQVLLPLPPFSVLFCWCLLASVPLLPRTRPTNLPSSLDCSLKCLTTRATPPCSTTCPLK